MARAIIAEGVAFDEEAREAFHEAMQWPEDSQTEGRDAQDRSARHAAQAIGTGNIDQMVMDAWARHQAQQQIDERQAAKAQAELEMELLFTSPTEWAAQAERDFDTANVPAPPSLEAPDPKPPPPGPPPPVANDALARVEAAMKAMGQDLS